MSSVSLLVELTGIAAEQLRDGTLMSGLLIAAAGAAGFNAVGLPAVRARGDGGVGLMILLDDAHIALHTFPDRGLLLLDFLGTPGQDARKAVDVFTRRLAPAAVQSTSRERG